MERRVTTFALALILAMSATPAIADEALATAKGCMACHQIDVKVVGPAYKEVAAKYKDDAAVVNALIDKVKAGGYTEVSSKRRVQVREHKEGLWTTGLSSA